jgi:hypothetical protein
MKRAILTCRCTSFHISEINKTYYLGQTLVLSEESYNKPYIIKAIEIGVFSVRWEQECRMKKPQHKHKAPPFIRVNGRKAPSAPSAPPPKQQADLVALEQLFTRIIRKEMQSLKSEILQEITKRPVAQQVQALKEVPAPTTDVWEDEEEPIYIPSDITNSGKVSGTMSVESVEKDSSVSDAAAALRAMKKKRRK